MQQVNIVLIIKYISIVNVYFFPCKIQGCARIHQWRCQASCGQQQRTISHPAHHRLHARGVHLTAGRSSMLCLHTLVVCTCTNDNVAPRSVSQMCSIWMVQVALWLSQPVFEKVTDPCKNYNTLSNTTYTVPHRQVLMLNAGTVDCRVTYSVLCVCSPPWRDGTVHAVGHW